MNDPIGRQLSESAYERDYRDKAIRRRVHPFAKSRGPIRAVVLADRELHSEMDAVAWKLRRRNIPVVRLDPESIPLESIQVDVARREVAIDKTWIKPTVFWCRDFPSSAVRASADGSSHLMAQKNWSELARQLACIAEFPINRLQPSVMDQILVADASCVTVPRTIISTDLTAAMAALDSSSVIVKTLSDHWVETAPGLLYGAFPVRVDSPVDANTSSLVGPLIIQEYIEHTVEYRVYAIGPDVLGFSVKKDNPHAVWKPNKGQVDISLACLPACVVNAVTKLQREFGLQYGAYDFLMPTDGGDAAFLEVNPSGNWLYYENNSLRKGAGRIFDTLRTAFGRRPVTEAVVRAIARNHNMITGAESCSFRRENIV